MFSSRTSWDRTPNGLSAAIAEAREAGQPLVDLTESNPTRCVIADLAPAIRELGHPRGSAYAPEPLGHPCARAAVAAYYAARGASIDPGNIVLSASTSESYAWLFSVLADPGDSILVPRPSYPLLPWIGASQGVDLTAYRLDRDADFTIDFADLERKITDRARAIVVVHPNNPTGSFVRKDEARRLAAIATDHDLALIVDEVFCDYAHGDPCCDAAPTFAGTSEALTFVLSGISKVLLLPQCKLAWTVVSGPSDRAAEALARIELVADTFLSVSSPVQLALADLLSAQPAVAAATRARLEANVRALDLALAAADTGARRLPATGGWYAVIDLLGKCDEDRLAETLVREDGVIVHPGYFFDFETDGFLVTSLLLPPDEFREAARRLSLRIAKEIGR
jgi:alanine-synthesizing transaminase